VTPPKGEQMVLTWTARDTFAVPAWSKISHVNESEDAAYIVAVSDRSFVDLLGLKRPALQNGNHV
jgi:gentisate 1,2-dioxygenase